MNVLQIKIHEDGTLECSPDFKIIRGSYRNILMNVEVPHSLLLDPVSENTDNGQIVDRNVNGNNLQVGAIIRTVTGKNLQTIRYGFQMVKDYIQNGIWYRLYQRIMPKEFTLWETVNQCEEAGNGYLDLVFNVVNWTKEETNAKIETVTASPILRLQVLASTFLNNVEDIDNPSQLDQLQSQTNELSSRVDVIETDLDLVKTQIVSMDERTETLENEVIEIKKNVSGLQNETHEIENNVYNLQNKTQELETDLQIKSQELKDDISNLRGEVNSKATFCGWFNNLADLKKAYPVATENDFAYIIENKIYVWKSGAWTNSGIDTPISVTPIVQTVGELTDAVMSQKAVTDAINAIPLGRTIAKTMDEWEMENPILNVGQFGYDTTNKITKIGDGITNWNDLNEFVTKTPPSFVNSTWEEIDNVSQSGLASVYFKIGDERKVILTTGEEITLIILGFNHDDLVSGGKAGITVGMKNLLNTTYKITTESSNTGGWNNTTMYKETIQVLFNQLPSDLSTVIKNVNKKYTEGNKIENIGISQDKLFLLAFAELFSQYGIQNASTAVLKNYSNIYIQEGKQYEYYKNLIGDRINTHQENTSLIKVLDNNVNNPYMWLLRTTRMDNNFNFLHVYDNGSIGYFNPPSQAMGVSYAFCI